MFQILGNNRYQTKPKSSSMPGQWQMMKGERNGVLLYTNDIGFKRLRTTAINQSLRTSSRRRRANKSYFTKRMKGGNSPAKDIDYISPRKSMRPGEWELSKRRRRRIKESR